MEDKILRLGIWFTLLAVLVIGFGMLPGISNAFAEVQCISKLENLSYAASFQSGSQMRLEIGEIMAPTGRRLSVAQIWAGRECQAVCQLKRMDIDQGYGPYALQMDCQGVRLNPLAAKATLLWGRGNRSDAGKAASTNGFTVLRFGDWLNGYSTAALRVDVDKYSQILRR